MSRILIAGGGIGGLATALAVTGAGHDAVVFERRPTFTELGAGLQLAPNALRVLDVLGVGDAVRRHAVHIDEIRVLDGTTGARIAEVPMAEEFRQRFGNPYVVVHRNDLYAPLVQACRRSPSVRLCGDTAVVGYEQDDSGVTAVLATGERVRGSALIGADGLHSTVRQQVVGDGAPRVSGHTIYRALIPVSAMPEKIRWNAVTLWTGPDCHVVHYPVSNWKYFNLAFTRDDGAREAVLGVPVSASHVRRQFAPMCDQIDQLIGCSDEWKTWVVCDRDPVPHWADGRVVLVGDAAHPMLQYAAQGAAMALEDAVFLGHLLADEDPDFGAVFDDFVSRRTGRTGQVQLISRLMCDEICHPQGERAQRRTELFSALPYRDLYDEFTWLYGTHDATPAPGSLLDPQRSRRLAEVPTRS